MATVAAVAVVISHHHAYELVSSHGECGLTAQLLPFTVAVTPLAWFSLMPVIA